MSRTVEIRLKQQVDVRVEKGKRVEHKGPDPERVGALIHQPLQAVIQAQYGSDVELRVISAAQSDVRLIGSFGDKPGLVKDTVWALLSDAIDGLDTDALG